MHKSVLLNEAIAGLNIKEDGIYIDATLGYGGHSSEILKRLTTGKLIAFDNDIDAINYSKNILSNISNNFILIHENFVNMKTHLEKMGIDKVDGILFELGESSPQIDQKERGFSFSKDALLDMRMNQDNSFSAYNVVNEYSQNELTNIFFKYGEEKKSKFIAEAIVKNRPINTTNELVNVIKNSVNIKYFNMRHPERRIFQAIRIEVNNELNVLNDVLPETIDLLNKNGRISIITFHSLEDRIVKKTFKKYSEVDEMIKGLPSIPDEYVPKIKLVNKKPIVPTSVEIEENSRSKSAKLRIIERV